MNPSTTRIGLGIAIYLSSLTYSSSSFAVSLKFSDRYELINVEEQAVFSQEFIDDSPNFNPDSELQPQFPDSSIITEANPLAQSPGLSIFAESSPVRQSSQSPDLAVTNEFGDSQPLISYLSQEAFSTSTLNIQIQTNPTESEDINLLSYLTNAIGNLQFDSIRENSFVNPNVIVLPQVAYENIYRGLYDFEISPVTPRVPRTVNSSVANDTLISRESISNFSSTLVNPPSFISNYRASSNLESSNSNPSTLYGNNPSVGFSDNSTNPQVNNSVYENLSTRLESVLSQNTNIYTNRQAIGRPAESDYVTATEKFNGQKDRKLRELEREREQQERLRTQRRQALERRMQQEQMQRERERQRQLITTRKRRENELRSQIQRQKAAQKRQ